MMVNSIYFETSNLNGTVVKLFLFSMESRSNGVYIYESFPANSWSFAFKRQKHTGISDNTHVGVEVGDR